jgi:hypothetical protein
LPILILAATSLTLRPKAINARPAKLLIGDDRITAALTAAFGGGFYPGARSLPNKVSLELREGAEQMEDQSASGRRGVHRLSQRPEPDASRIQRGNGVDQMGQRAAKTIEFPNNENVLGADVGDGGHETWPICLRARRTILEDVLAARRLQRV